jgi:hypothetical protein
MTWRASITTKMLSIVGLTCIAVAVIVGVSLVAFNRFTLAVQNIYEHGVVDMNVVSRIALDVEAQRGLAGRARRPARPACKRKWPRLPSRCCA